MVKGIVNAFDHTEFCLVVNLTTTSAGGKWAVTWSPIFATRYVTLLPTSCYLQKKLIFTTAIARIQNIMFELND